MKMILFALLLSSLGFAARPPLTSNPTKVPQCFRQTGVAEDAPYLLVLFDFDKSSASKVVSALEASPTVKVEGVTGRIFIIISLSSKVSDSQPHRVDTAIAGVVHKTVQKFAPWNSKYTFNCNGKVRPLPRAGGMNGVR